MTARATPDRRKQSGMRLWLTPMAILGGIALVIFASLYLLDNHVTGGIQDATATGAGRYVRFEPGLITDALVRPRRR